MRKLAVALFAVAACGGSDAKPDAAIIKIIDAAIDARPDAPPPPPPIDAQVFDFSCAGMPLPTTAIDPVTISGSVQEITMSGIAAVVGASVASFKTGNTTALDTVTSGAGGAFTSGNLATGGTPLDGYVEATVPGTGGGASLYRGSFIYPPAPLTKNQMNTPVLMLKQSTFNTLQGFAGGAAQDDTANGALILQVVDCANTPINGATITAVQGTTDVSGQTFDLGQLSSMAAGTFFVFNVPDGATSVGAMYMGHTFRTHTVAAHKKDDAALINGSLTLTIVKPGP